MFDALTERLSTTVNRLRGQARLTEENIQESLREVRVALLEADVALPVIKTFVEHVKQKALGAEVMRSLTPGQAFIKVVHDELVHIMGATNETLNLNVVPPAVVLLAGLQGSGKTTTTAKLAKWLQERQHKKVAVVSCDIYRPAAIQQLQRLAQQINVSFIESNVEQDPVLIANNAVDYARIHFFDVLLVDTAGRLHVDDEMMTEIKRIHAEIQPVETIFVVDSMSGQDAAVSAQAFNTALPLTGVILTKADGDARGGAALSVRHLTGKPIKFIGMGEKIHALEPFYPDRMASRILGMGDVISLVEEAEHTVDRQQAQKLVSKIKKGKVFDLVDLKSQLEQMQKMGGLAGLMDKLPGGMKLPTPQLDDRVIRHMVAMIDSMTPQERRFPDVIRNTRKQRIAKGSGTQIQDVNRLLKQHAQMSKMMKKFSKKGGLRQMMRALKGKMPPGTPLH